MPNNELPLGARSADEAMARGLQEYRAEQARLLSIASKMEEESVALTQEKEKELSELEGKLAASLAEGFQKKEEASNE